MPFTNYHTHSDFCDGVGEPEKYVEEAIKLGMQALGFSSHAPLPFAAPWCMKQDRLHEYAAAIRRLKKEYAGQIEVHLGLEIDYLPGVMGPFHEKYIPLELDYRIGSVHFGGMFPDGKRWTVDSRPERFDTGFRESFSADPRQLVAAYYHRIRRMVSEQCPDIIGHFDLVKLNNIGDRYFSEDESWYRHEVQHALEAIAGSGAIIEVNLGAVNKGKLTEPYPSVWILSEILGLGTPITLNSDSHRPEHLTKNFELYAQTLLDLGFRELSVLTCDGWIQCPFGRSGIL